jgi:hypothetical protein
MSVDLRKCSTDVLRYASAIIHSGDDQIVFIEVECEQVEAVVSEICCVLDGVEPDELDAEIRRRAN